MALGAPLTRPGFGTQPGGRQVNAEPHGARTGAPTRTVVRGISVAVGNVATQIVPDTVENRVVTVIAPNVAWSVFVGGEGVGPSGFALPAGLPHDLVLPGGQSLYAVQNGPVPVQLQVQIAPILVGDTERR